MKGAGGSRFFGLAAAFFAAARAATFSWAAFRICCLVLEVGVFLAENSRDGVELADITSASVSRVLPSSTFFQFAARALARLRSGPTQEWGLRRSQQTGVWLAGVGELPM